MDTRGLNTCDGRRADVCIYLCAEDCRGNEQGGRGDAEALLVLDGAHKMTLRYVRDFVSHYGSKLAFTLGR